MSLWGGGWNWGKACCRNDEACLCVSLWQAVCTFLAIIIVRWHVPFTQRLFVCALGSCIVFFCRTLLLLFYLLCMACEGQICCF